MQAPSAPGNGAPAGYQATGHWSDESDQPNVCEERSIRCRLCEEYVPTHWVEDHSKVCAVADRCDQKGFSIDERLIRVAETLEKLVESYSLADYPGAVSHNGAKVSNSSINEESNGPSSKLSNWSRRGSANMPDSIQETDNTTSTSYDDIINLPPVTCETPRSSAGSMTPRSPLITPRSNHIDMLSAEKSANNESDELLQTVELAVLARRISNMSLDEEGALSKMVTCMEDMQEIINHRKHHSLTVQAFGARIVKLQQEKYQHLYDSVNMKKVDSASHTMTKQDDVVHSLQASVANPIKGHPSIDDFEIIRPISHCAFGHVSLAKKKTTGDLFAIKVLRKADIVQKSFAESILTERDILITVQNPFVVRFFYSFTSRENLYLVMEYLNGGNLYSLLRNHGCLDEEVARLYLAEVVLALEYLHFLHIVHRGLKSDNLFIAHDGHIKGTTAMLAEFGLSKVGLIDSTKDMPDTVVSGAALYEYGDLMSELKHPTWIRKRSAAGTPDYLAPELLLGTGCGTSADWWSVGVILFELIVGMPAFNAEHPQAIFDYILNRKIHWPVVPEKEQMVPWRLNNILSLKALAGIPLLGRRLPVPSSDSAFDASCFTSRCSCNLSDETIYKTYDFEDSSDNRNRSSSCASKRQDGMGDCCCVSLMSLNLTQKSIIISETSHSRIYHSLPPSIMICSLKRMVLRNLIHSYQSKSRFIHSK